MKYKYSPTTVGVLLVMVLTIASALFYVFSIDESDRQKRNNTDAAQALIIEDPKKSFTDLNGNTLQLSDYLGKVVVVTSWASWCPQCAADLPQLAVIANEFRERGVVVVAINRSESTDVAERFLRTISVPEGLQLVLDPSDHFYSANESYAMPETILFDTKGAIVLQQRGSFNADEMRSAINNLLSS